MERNVSRHRRSMSGICGICQMGRELDRLRLDPMLAALAVAGEPELASLGGKSAGFGLVKGWPFQQLASIPGVRVAADAELLNLPELRKELINKGLDPAAMSVAEMLAWLYTLRGTQFVEQLHGAFSLVLCAQRQRRP